ncbi:MAG: FtsX-like permease family protein [Desulfobacterales bacterium]|nr:MAG: FtsX-like permease family protein [Desulfobacterales bacterium]
MLALPPKTDLLSLPLQAGNRLSDENADDVVLNQISRSLLPGVGIGDCISLSIGNTPHKWRIVGFVEDVASPATAFFPLNTFKKVTHTGSLANMIRISFQNRGFKNARMKTIEIENLLSRERISVNQSIPVSLLDNAMAKHMGVLVNSLLAISILMGRVGALGLMSAMSMNVSERTRVTGVLRAIGATPKKIRRLMINEGLLSGIISILTAFGLSLLLSFYMGQLIGIMALRAPLPLSVSSVAMMIWVLIRVAGSIAATMHPAGRAEKITTRQALSYE